MTPHCNHEKIILNGILFICTWITSTEIKSAWKLMKKQSSISNHAGWNLPLLHMSIVTRSSYPPGTDWPKVWKLLLRCFWRHLLYSRLSIYSFSDKWLSCPYVKVKHNKWLNLINRRLRWHVYTRIYTHITYSSSSRRILCSSSFISYKSQINASSDVNTTS